MKPQEQVEQVDTEQAKPVDKELIELTLEELEKISGQGMIDVGAGAW